MAISGISKEEYERVQKMVKEGDIDGIVEYLTQARLKAQKKECACRMPTYYNSPEGAKGHCTCGAL